MPSNDGDNNDTDGDDKQELIKNAISENITQESSHMDDTDENIFNGNQNALQESSIDSDPDFSSPILLNPDQNMLENEADQDSDSRDEDEKIRLTMINSNWYKVSINITVTKQESKSTPNTPPISKNTNNASG